jgi:hypothetical protein
MLATYLSENINTYLISLFKHHWYWTNIFVGKELPTSEAWKNNVEINYFLSETNILKHILNDTPGVDYRYNRECSKGQSNMSQIYVCLLSDFIILIKFFFQNETYS